jgi:anti-anti-sigma factor
VTDQGVAEDAGRQPPAVLVAYCEGVTVLDLVGEHDLATSDEITLKITEQARLNRNVVVSLKDTAFIDSAVIAALFRAHREMREANRKFVLHTDCDAPVLAVLQMTGVDDEIPCANSLDDAVALARGNG